MILCLDAGNTRLKLALGDTRGWVSQAAIPLQDLDRLPSLLADWQRPERIIGCNVAGSAVAGVVDRALAGLPIEWVHASAQRAGVINRYERPAQLGADRWAALIGARALHDGPALVVNAGTATTLDVLDGDGIFQGGVILPGIDLMRRALAGGTAQLPEACGHHAAYPRNTDDAIVSGTLEATAGAVDRLFSRLRNDPRALCVLSGGAAETLVPHLSLPLRSVDDLVLQGLLRLADA